MENNDYHDELSRHYEEEKRRQYFSDRERKTEHFKEYQNEQMKEEILEKRIQSYESFKIVEPYGQENFFFPADFSIQLKSLGEFDFSTLRCEVEVLVRIKIFCYEYPEYIDDFFLKTTLIWEDGTVEKLTPEKCLFIDKDQNERQVKFMFLRKITCTIQGKMFTSPIQQINMYTSLQIQPISVPGQHKQEITLRVNFPDFSIQKKKRNQKLIKKIKKGNYMGKQKSRIAKVKEMKNKITETFQINFCGHSPQKIQQQNPKNKSQQQDQNNQGSKGEINTVVKGRKNYKAFDLRFEANFKNKYYLPAKYLYQIISAYENYQDEVDKLNIHSKMNFYEQKSQKNKKKIQNSQAGLINRDISPLTQYNFQLYSHNQVRMKIKIYKEPIQTLLAIMLPVGLLSFINCAIFFQPPSLQDRIGSIASILIAYGTTVLQVRRQIAPATQWTLMEIVLYFQTICCILTLVHGMRILNQKEATYNFDWKTNQLFLVVLIASLICTSVFILVALKYLFYNLPKYKYNFREQQQKKKQNFQKTEQYAIVLAKKNKGNPSEGPESQMHMAREHYYQRDGM